MDHTILVIEANQDQAGTVGRTLRHEPFHLIVVAHPQDALRFVEQPIDLIICDLALARSKSIGLLRHRQQPAECPPLVVMIDAGDVQSAVEAMKLGAVDCLTKPIDSERLREQVTRSLGSGDTNNWPHHAAAAADDDAEADSDNSDSDLEVPAGTSLAALERVAIRHALEKHRGNRTHAAQELGISVRTLQRKLKAWQTPIVTLHRYSAGPDVFQPSY